MGNKKIIICLLAAVFLVLAFSFVFSATANVSCDKAGYGYPWCNSSGDLGGSSGLINTIYNYSLAAVGIAALGAIIYGGIMYTVSAGNPSKQSDAVAWITGAIWGIVLLLGASLLLRTINPEIVKLKSPTEYVKNQNIQAEKILDPYVTSTIINGKEVYFLNYAKMCSVNKSRQSCESVTGDGVSKCQWVLDNNAILNKNNNASYMTDTGACQAK